MVCLPVIELDFFRWPRVVIANNDLHHRSPYFRVWGSSLLSPIIIIIFNLDAFNDMGIINPLQLLVHCLVGGVLIE